MKKEKKDLIKIGVALVVLFAIAIPLSLHREKRFKKEEAEESSKKFITFDVASVDRIQITNAEGLLEIQKRKKVGDKFQDELTYRDFEFAAKPQWIVTQPFRDIADAMHMNGFLSQVGGLQYQKVIQEDQSRVADYGLAEPKLLIRFFDSGQSEAKLTIKMGSENPTSTGFYFTASDKPGIYLGERMLQPYIDELPSEWRERRVFESPNLDDIFKVSVHFPVNPNNSFEAEKKDGKWQLLGNRSSVEADQAALNDFVGHVNGMRAMQIFDDHSVASKSKRIAEINFHMKGHEGPIQFYVLDGGRDPNIYYFQRTDLSTLFSLAAPDRKLIFSFQNAADKHLFSKSAEDLTSVKVTYEGILYDMSKVGKDWKIIKPYQDVVDYSRLEDFFKLLKDEEPLTYETGKSLSPGDRRLSVEYTLKDNSRGEIVFYQNQQMTYARVEENGKSKVVSLRRIPKEMIEDISHFRSTDLISIPEEHLKYISFERDGMKVELERKKDTHWFIKTLANVSPTVNMKWKEAPLSDQFFLSAAKLYIRDFVEHSESGEKFETASFTVVADDGQELHWKFGKRKGDFIDVFSPERNVVGRVSWRQYKEVSAFLDEPEKTKK